MEIETRQPAMKAISNIKEADTLFVLLSPLCLLRHKRVRSQFRIQRKAEKGCNVCQHGRDQSTRSCKLKKNVFFHENSTKISQICGKTNIVIEETNPKTTRETALNFKISPMIAFHCVLTLNLTPPTIATVQVPAV